MTKSTKVILAAPLLILAGVLILIPAQDPTVSHGVALGCALILAPLCIGAAFTLLDAQEGTAKPRKRF